MSSKYIHYSNLHMISSEVEFLCTNLYYTTCMQYKSHAALAPMHSKENESNTCLNVYLYGYVRTWGTYTVRIGQKLKT
jgi:hypothetical protein